MPETIYNADWVELLPTVLTHDKRMVALAKVIAENKRAIAGEIWHTRVWNGVDRQPEEILDVLAQEMRIPWYDYNSDVEEKRKTIKLAVAMWRTMGTPYAVRVMLESLAEGSYATEWFDYGGTHHRYRLTLEDPSPEALTRVRDDVDMVKRISAWLDGVTAEFHGDEGFYIGSGVLESRSASYEFQSEEESTLYLPVALADEDGMLLTDEDGAILTEDNWQDESGNNYTETEVRD